MRRVPEILQGRSPKYALLGSGRLARHLQFYFKVSQTPVLSWSRDGQPSFNSFSSHNPAIRLEKILQSANILLLAVSDDSLGELREFSQALSQKSNDTEKVYVHFSAAQNIDETIGLHPLMTFNQQLLPLSQYAEIPFCEPSEHQGAFRKLFPMWSNPVFHLNAEMRSLYHAYLVMAGNFTTILWNQVEKQFENKLQLNPKLLLPYKQQVFINCLQSASGAITGPFARKDFSTIAKNQSALNNDELRSVYQSFYDMSFTNKGPL